MNTINNPSDLLPNGLSVEDLLDTVHNQQMDLSAFKDENQQLNQEMLLLHDQINLLQQQLVESESELLANEQNGVAEIQQLQSFRDIFCHLHFAIFLIDHHGSILQSNDKAQEYLNKSQDELSSHNLRKLLSSESSYLLLTLLRHADSELRPQQPQFASLKNGQTFQLEVQPFVKSATAHPKFNNQFLIFLHPISMQKISEQSLRIAHSIIDQLREGVMITDAQSRIVKVNQAFCEITGYPPEEVLEKTPAILQSGRHDHRFYQDMWLKLKNNGWWSGEIWNRRKSSEIYPQWLQVSRIRDEASQQVFYAATFSDITDRKEHQHQLDRLAFYDSLTGLPNRTLLNQFLDTTLSRYSPTAHSSMAVFFMDLDKFKEVNDHFGHAEGDLILREATQRITSRIRENDLAARIGGDEFVLVLSRLQSQNNATDIAKDLVELLATPFKTNNAIHRLSASIGIAFFPQHGLDSSNLMRRADAAMYRAKALGRNRYQIFEESDEQTLVATNATIELLWKAIEQPLDYIEMHYQPICCAATQQIHDYEALIRLKTPDGLIYPSVFIEVAEQNSLISKLGLALFEKVCQDIKSAQLPPSIKVAVNLSAMQFQEPKLLSQLELIAKNHTLSLANFNFEVTETATMQNINSMVSILLDFQQKSCQLFLDDFGTGFASLSMLKNLPINVVKIDRSFISELETSSDAQNLVKAMIAMAKALSLKIVTEGVETHAQLDWLCQQQVDYIQGYLLGKPQKEFLPHSTL